jgi:hypothetical protein
MSEATPGDITLKVEGTPQDRDIGEVLARLGDAVKAMQMLGLDITIDVSLKIGVQKEA